jgi:hypothetical protein
VPCSFFRVSEMAGYGAENRAPFYQACYDLVAAGRADDIALEHAIAVLRQIRKAGEPLSTADAIAITHHASMLARLRGRHHATLDDALITCCCKGDPRDEGLKLRSAMDAAGIGNKIGKVTPKLGRLPIVADFQGQLADLYLGAVLGKKKRLALRLDERGPLDARRSAFSQRLAMAASQSRAVPSSLPLSTLSPWGEVNVARLRRSSEAWRLSWLACWRLRTISLV